jgi:hypothetical protein
MSSSVRSDRRMRIGNGFIWFSGVVLTVSSIVKCLHPEKAVAYMRFLGYEHEKLFLIAAMELALAVLYLRRSSRAVGLLLVSSYLGGAIAAHLADHPLIGDTPIILFNARHHYLGTAPAVILLLCAWLGVWLRHPESLWSFSGEFAAQGAGTPAVLPRAQREPRTLEVNAAR